MKRLRRGAKLSPAETKKALAPGREIARCGGDGGLYAAARRHLIRHGFAINEGDYLALCDGKLLGTDRSLDVLLDKLAHVAADKNAEFVTVYSGQGVTEDDAARAAKVFETICPDAEVAALPGGQPVYYYIIAIE